VIALLFILITIGIILESISLRRDPNEVDADGVLSKRVAEPGEPFHMETIVTNKSLIPVSYLSIREIFPTASKLPGEMTYKAKSINTYTKKICRLRGRQRKKLILETSIQKRGVHLFMGEYIEFGDFLGFREISREASYEQDIVIYPEKIKSKRLADTLAKFTGDIAAKRHLIRDPILTVGCREYTGREPMKEIHWLKSAQRGDLVVREFDYTRQISVSVILSIEGLNFLDEDSLDECCATARTVCETLIEAGVAIRFFTNSRLTRKFNKSIWSCRVSTGHTGELLEGLGRVSAYVCSTMEKLVDYSLRESDFDSSYIVILPTDDNRGNEVLDKIRSNSSGDALIVQGAQTNEVSL